MYHLVADMYTLGTNMYLKWIKPYSDKKDTNMYLLKRFCPSDSFF